MSGLSIAMVDQIPTMQDVADAVGVSRSTVSRALRGHRTISPATRERILKVAEELGYHTHPMVAALMSNLRGTHPLPKKLSLAYISFYDQASTWRNNLVQREMFEGAREQGERFGFVLNEISFKDLGNSVNRLNQVLWHRGIQGVMLGSAFPDVHRSLDIDWSKFCGVSVGSVMEGRRISCVRHNHSQGMALTFSKLLQLGYQRIGFFISRGMDEQLAGAWTMAYLYGQLQLSPKNRIGVQFYTDRISVDERKKVFQDWLRKARPDAVICVTSDKGIELEWAAQAGFPVPDVLGFTVLSNRPDLPISGINQCPRTVGVSAMNLLSSMVFRGERGESVVFREVILDGKWEERETTRRRQ